MGTYFLVFESFFWWRLLRSIALVIVRLYERGSEQIAKTTTRKRVDELFHFKINFYDDRSESCSAFD